MKSFFGLILMIASVTLSGCEKSRIPSVASDSRTKSEKQSLNPNATGTEIIDRFIEDLSLNRFSNIDEAIGSLPEKARSSFTLVHHAHGLRETTYARPGVVMFANDGAYAITFGDESLGLGQEIEIARVSENHSKIELIKAVFPPENTLSFTTRPAIHVVNQPVECITCHQQDSKLLWGPYVHFADSPIPGAQDYESWVGVYGGFDDLIMPDLLDFSEFQDFLHSMNSLDRYRRLIPVHPVGIPNYPTSIYSPYTEFVKDMRMELRPNSRFTSIVSRVDANRVARKIITAPNFENVSVDLLAHLLSCDPNPQITLQKLNATLASLDVHFDDFQPHFLEPEVSGEFPIYLDGGTPRVDSEYNWNYNHLLPVVTNEVYKAVSQLHPELGLQSAYQTLSQEEYASHYFTHQPSLDFYAGIDALGLPIDIEFSRAHGICDLLSR